MPRKKKAETENNIEIQYIHTPLDNGAELVTASVPEKMTQEEFEKSLNSLLEKWKGWLTMSRSNKSQISLKTHIKRKQDIKL